MQWTEEGGWWEDIVAWASVIVLACVIVLFQFCELLFGDSREPTGAEKWEAQRELKQIRARMERPG